MNVLFLTRIFLAAQFSAGPLANTFRLGPNLVPPPTSNPASTTAAPTTGASTSSTGSTGTQPPTDSNNYAGVFAQMLNMMSNQNLVSAQMEQSDPPLIVRLIDLFQNTPPDQRYAAQLEQLVGMGFTNREANLQGK